MSHVPTSRRVAGKIPREWLVRDLWRVKQQLGRPPNSGEYHEHGRYSHQPYDRVWGSWREAIAGCGLDPDDAHLRGGSDGE